MSTIIDQVDTQKRLWLILLPFVAAPDEHQLSVWSRQFTIPEFEYAFTRAAKKFGPHRGVCPPAETVHRYITGILLNERQKNTAPVTSTK
jgi:hypothetical protein